MATFAKFPEYKYALIREWTDEVSLVMFEEHGDYIHVMYPDGDSVIDTAYYFWNELQACVVDPKLN